MQFKIPGFLRTAMDQVFSSHEPEQDAAPPQQTVKVTREDLTAFVTNQPFGDRQTKLTSGKLARSWEFAADQFELSFLGQENTTATEELRTEHAVEAMHSIAGKIREAADFGHEIELETADVETVVNASDLFLRAKLARDAFDEELGVETPNVLEGLHFKANMFLGPYIPDANIETVSVPIQKIDNIVSPSFEAMGIKPDDRFAHALAMEKLGDMMTDVYDGYYEVSEAHGPYMLQTHLYDIAVRLRKADPDAESIEIPKSTIKGMEYTLDHMQDAVKFLRNPGGLHGTGIPTEKQLNDREILRQGYTGIWHEMSEYFDNTKPVVRSDYGLE